MNRIPLVRLLAFLALLQPVTAVAADWVVAKVSQPSRYTVDKKTWITIKPGMTISNQSWISTGPRGRVTLQRNKDRVTFQPGTLVGVFERAGMAIHTDFAQQSGVINLDIDPQKKPHLAVQTPFLAAVVKGTQFSVTVNKSGAKVGVARGRVEVTDAQTGERTGVRAGQEAKVDSNPQTPMALSGSNTDFEPVVKAAAFTPMLPPSGETTVQGDPADTANNPANEDGKRKAPNGENGLSPQGENLDNGEDGKVQESKGFFGGLFSPQRSEVQGLSGENGTRQTKDGKSVSGSGKSGGGWNGTRSSDSKSSSSSGKSGGWGSSKSSDSKSSSSSGKSWGGWGSSKSSSDSKSDSSSGKSGGSSSGSSSGGGWGSSRSSSGGGSSSGGSSGGSSSSHSSSSGSSSSGGGNSSGGSSGSSGRSWGQSSGSSRSWSGHGNDGNDD